MGAAGWTAARWGDPTRDWGETAVGRAVRAPDIGHGAGRVAVRETCGQYLGGMKGPARRPRHVQGRAKAVVHEDLQIVTVDASRPGRARGVQTVRELLDAGGHPVSRSLHVPGDQVHSHADVLR